MRHTDSIASLAPALVAAQAEIEGATQSGENTHLKSKYATLEDVIAATHAILAKHKLALLQFPGAIEDGKVNLETMILHDSGEYIVGDAQMGIGKGDPQSVGSALTYIRRYAQKAGLNIPDLDDDAQGVREADKPKRGAKITPEPIGDDWPGCEGRKGVSSHEARQTGLDGKFKEFKAEIETFTSMTEVGGFHKARTPEIANMPVAWRKALREVMDAQVAEIRKQAEVAEAA